MFCSCEDFPHKGEYIVYDKGWARVGFSDTPQYLGQLPIKFPLDWPNFVCHLASDDRTHNCALLKKLVDRFKAQV